MNSTKIFLVQVSSAGQWMAFTADDPNKTVIGFSKEQAFYQYCIQYDMGIVPTEVTSGGPNTVASANPQ